MNTVAKLMAELGLIVQVVIRRSGLTRQGKRPTAPNFAKRDFTSWEPDPAWAGNMTEIATEEGKQALPRYGDRPALLAPARLRNGCSPRRGPGRSRAEHIAASRSGDVRGVISHNIHRLRSVCGSKIPIGYETEYWAGFTLELAAQEGLHSASGLTILKTCGIATHWRARDAFAPSRGI
ncbi:hypothetical protein [Streptomyces sp. NRRL F-6491]|uniref:hypothetical protein n=1 Tax=Streptomyces sp. NRRL F-6491 TaxID=1519495 RepID=UPI00131C3725|nr:hypothetical protein [Streptomyces sp. NRRL F-6491]